MARKVATQQDVAGRSKVSRSTVAAVLRHDPNFSFSPQTRQRVFEAAQELNYRPHFGAQALRGGRTHTLALAIPHFGVGGTIQSQNLCGMGAEAQSLGYSLTICSYGTPGRMKPTFERLMRESRFDGVVMHGDDTCAQDPREEIVHAFGLPCVVLERRSGQTPWVDFDHQRGGADATRHLIALGRRRIALLGVLAGASHEMRRAGYLEAMAEAGLPVEDRLVYARLSSESYQRLAYRAVDELWGDPSRTPDALFCLSDEIAAASIAALTQRGVRVPDDVAVVGYDDSPLARYANPPLTSVRQDGVEMGRLAVRMLTRLIDQADEPIEPVILAPSLTIRRSCGAPDDRAALE